MTIEIVLISGKRKFRISSLLVSLRGILLLIAAFYFMPIWLGTNGLWLAVPAAEIITNLCAIFCLIATDKKTT